MVRAEALSPADLVAVAWRYRLPAIVAAVVCAGLAYGYSLTVPNQFTATTLVLVDDEAPSSSYVRSPVTVDLDARLRTIRDQVLSRTVLQQVMDRYGLFPEGNSWEDRLTKMRNRIDISVSRSDGFRLSFTYTDPEVARDVTNTLASLFIDDSTQAVLRQSQGTASMLDTRLQEVSQKLSEKEQEIADFKAAHMGSLPEQVSGTLSTLDWAKGQLGNNTADLASARDRQARLEQLAASQNGPVTSTVSARQLALDIVSSTGAEDLDRKLASQPPAVRLEALKLRRESLLTRRTPRPPDVQMLDMEIAALQQQGAAGAFESPAGASATGITGAALIAAQLDQVNREIHILEQRRNELRTQIDELDARIAAAPEVEQQILELQRDREAQSRAYDEIRGRSMEASLAGNLEPGGPTGFKVVDPAVTPQKKSAPSRTYFLLAGGLFGLVISLAAGMAREMILQPIHDSAELERHMGVAVLGSIPAIDGPRRRSRRLLLRATGTVLVVGTLVGVFVLRMLS